MRLGRAAPACTNAGMLLTVTARVVLARPCAAAAAVHGLPPVLHGVLTLLLRRCCLLMVLH